MVPVEKSTMSVVPRHSSHRRHGDNNDNTQHRAAKHGGEAGDGVLRRPELLHSPEEQSTDKAMLRRIMDAAKDCDQSIFLNGLT
jgi:hypothetical protein